MEKEEISLKINATRGIKASVAFIFSRNRQNKAWQGVKILLCFIFILEIRRGKTAARKYKRLSFEDRKAIERMCKSDIKTKE